MFVFFLSTVYSTVLEIHMLSKESLSHVQGQLITQTCSPLEQNKKPREMGREETVSKDPGMLQGLVKEWKGYQVNVDMGHNISFDTLFH